MGNVQQGCAGATQCIIYLSGGGTVTTAGIQNDLKILTAGLPPGVGLIAHRPSDYLGNLYVYSSSDIENLKGDAGAYSPQFGSRLVTVGVSDGVRAMRSAAGSYGQQAGIWIEIDQFSIFPIPALDTTRSFQVVSSYSTRWPAELQPLFNTGPLSYTGPSDRYSIILNTAGLQNIFTVHNDTIQLGIAATNGALLPALSNDLPGMRYVFMIQVDGQWLEVPVGSGEPGVTAPPQGGPGSPSGGGGIGIESFPAWLRTKKVLHGKPEPH